MSPSMPYRRFAAISALTCCIGLHACTLLSALEESEPPSIQSVPDLDMSSSDIGPASPTDIAPSVDLVEDQARDQGEMPSSDAGPEMMVDMEPDRDLPADACPVGQLTSGEELATGDRVVAVDAMALAEGEGFVIAVATTDAIVLYKVDPNNRAARAESFNFQIANNRFLKAVEGLTLTGHHQPGYLSVFYSAQVERALEQDEFSGLYRISVESPDLRTKGTLTDLFEQPIGLERRRFNLEAQLVSPGKLAVLNQRLSADAPAASTTAPIQMTQWAKSDQPALSSFWNGVADSIHRNIECQRVPETADLRSVTTTDALSDVTVAQFVWNNTESGHLCASRFRLSGELDRSPGLSDSSPVRNLSASRPQLGVIHVRNATYLLYADIAPTADRLNWVELTDTWNDTFAPRVLRQGTDARMVLRNPAAAVIAQGDDPVLMSWQEDNALMAARLSVPPQAAQAIDARRIAADLGNDLRTVMVADERIAIVVTYAPGENRPVKLYRFSHRGQPLCPEP